jgi:hypothetical protein
MRIAHTVLVAACVSAAGGCAAVRHADGGGCTAQAGDLSPTAHWLEVTPGERRELGRPAFIDPMMGSIPVAPQCRVAWSVRGTQAAVDGRGMLSVRPDAVPGDSFEVLVRVGRTWGSQPAYVVDPVASPLVGRWTQRDGTCPSGLRPSGLIGELIFMRNGQFSLTAQPFEYHVDYRGRYRYDTAGLRLSLTWPGAAGTRTYHAGLNGDGELVIDAFATPSDPPCDAIFRRVSTTY